MTAYVALLYSVVLGSGRRVNMGELRDMAAGLGFSRPRTLVATGNLVFEAHEAPVAEIEGHLEPAFAATFGRHVDIIVRRADDWPRLVAANPFPDESAADGRFVNVRVMRDPLDGEAEKALRQHMRGDERLHVVDGDLWAYFAHGVARSRLASVLTPKRFGVGTMRNWNTVRRIAHMLGA